MTIEEFRQRTLADVVDATDAAQAREVLKAAASTLNESKIQDVHQRQFWADLYSDLKDRRVLVERQGASALSAIIAAAQSAVAAYVAAGGGK